MDCQGLGLAVRDDPSVAALLTRARDRSIRTVVSGLTLLEAQHPNLAQPRFRYTVSRLVVQEVTAEITEDAMRLLRETGLHGHKYAIDAVVAATALRLHGPVTLATSDADDMAKLCGKRVHLVPV